MPDEQDVSDTSRKKTCEICTEIIRTSGIKCVSCMCYLHTKCFEKVAKVFVVQRLNWRCRACVTKDATKSDPQEDINMQVMVKENEYIKRELELLKKVVEDKDYTIQLQKERLSDLANTTVSNVSLSNSNGLRSSATYSSVLKSSHKNISQHSAVLIIKSHEKNVNDADIVKQIKDTIDPYDLNISITNTRKIKNGLLVNCDNQDMLNKLKSNLINRAPDKFSVSEGKKFNPRIKIHRLDKDVLNGSDFINKLINNNGLNCSPSDIKIVTTQDRKTHANVVIEVPPSVHKIIMSSGRVFAGWKSCAVYDHFSIPRCFKCSRYGHIRTECKSEHNICPTCAGHHEDCQSEDTQCINCIEFNKQNKASVLVNHSVRDRDCHVYKTKVNILIAKTNYV